MSPITPYGSLRCLQNTLANLVEDIRKLETGAALSPDDLNNAPMIDRWEFDLVPTRCIVGTISGHPFLSPGARARTSQIILCDAVNGWARTWSRYYRLGAPEPPRRSKVP